ncbi:hypothetical protein EV44_g1952 [Erysiphe necator]|uniref:Non-classical export protein 1 n=1 Tax=Uncinula necator TaxID=52586 RepID=A0A0B1PGB3_UNCNE|nr:hypothetical protein EV44_g1952 [Erysiphe necator]
MHPPPKYLISKLGDPLFAIATGLASAAVKINRKEKEMGHSTQETISAARRRSIKLWNSFVKILPRAAETKLNV